jgi:hypothetical protein
MVERAVNSVFQILKDKSGLHLDADQIAGYLGKLNDEGFVEKVFTEVGNCIQTNKDKFENLHNLVSLALNVFGVPYLETANNVIRFICKIVLCIIGKNDSFSMISKNVRSELSKKMKDVEEKLHAFCTCFDARYRDLNSGKSDEQVVKLLDDVNYKEIGMGFTGELQAIISRHKNDNDEEILRCVGELLDVYVRVAIMRWMMQILILSMIPEEKMKSASEQMKKYIEGDTMWRVEFLLEILTPSHANAVFLSSFNIRDFPQVYMFLKSKCPTTKGHPCVWETSAFLTNKNIALQPVVFRGYWMNAAYSSFVWSTSNAPYDADVQFCFEVVSENENVFFVRSFYRKTYLYMKPNLFLSQTSTQPTEEGMFKVLRLLNDKCLISVVKYPGRFIYMENSSLGKITGAVTNEMYHDGQPTEQHEWSLQEVCHRRNGNVINILKQPKLICAFINKY